MRSSRRILFAAARRPLPPKILPVATGRPSFRSLYFLGKYQRPSIITAAIAYYLYGAEDYAARRLPYTLATLRPQAHRNWRRSPK